MKSPHSAATVCGWVSLLCWVPYLFFSFSKDRLRLPKWTANIVLWTAYISPFAGILLALIAAFFSRRWLALGAAWLTAILYGLRTLWRHPFDED